MRSILLALAAPLALLSPSAPPHAAAPPALAEPGISPDGREIAFVAGGDIWTVPAAGGEARLLVSHPAAESRPLYSPDGRRLAFVSTRTGNGDVYLLTLATGELRRLTFDDQPETLGAWSPDGEWIYFHSTSRDVAGMNDVYRVRAQGGTPMIVSGDRYMSEFFPAPHRDGRTLAVVARGFGAAQWWRKGRSHLDESELWLVRLEDGGARYEQLTPRGAKQLWPMWSADGNRLFFVSDRNGAENVWVRAENGNGTPVTKFGDGHVLWPSITSDGRTIAFERDFGLWTLDTQSGAAKPIDVTLRGASAAPLVEHLTLTSGFQELALSPDGKKVAFVARGEIFAASAKDGGEAARVTISPAVEQQLAWSPDSRSLAYVSNRDGGVWHVYQYDFATGAERQLTRGPASDVAPRWSPDGRMLAFQRGARELRVLDVASGSERLLARGLFDLPPFVSTRATAWSPDSRWIAYLTSAGNKEFTNAWVVPAAGGEARPASELANSFAGTLSWSPDGRYLLFDSRQRTEQGSLVRVDLVPRTPRFREDLFRDLFREEQPRTVVRAPQADSAVVRQASRDAASADSARTTTSRRVDVDFEAIRRRAALLPTGVDVGWQAISPDGKSVLMIAGAAGQQNIYTYSLDEMARETPVARQITSTPGGKSWAQWSPDGREIYYLEQGRIAIVPVESRTPRTLAVTAELDVDFGREKMEIFQQGWGYLRDQFFDPTFNGVDWDAQRARIAPYVEAARTPDELRRIMSLMIGDLNASHTGVNAPGGGAPQTGRLGLRFDRAAYERDGTFRVTEVLPLSPAALAGITVGTLLRSVDGVALGRGTNLDSLLAFKIDRRVTLGLDARTVTVRPVNATTEKGLLYRSWVDWNRAYVERASGGRLGYVHMLDMSDASLAQLHLDLDASNHAKEGVVVDVRNNNGGFVNAYAIDVLSRRGYLYFTNRNGSGTPIPARSQLGQRSLETPTILLTNQHSLSDAEDFTEGYRALELGTVVGEPTAGWIVYTSNVPLLDGTVVRLPGTLVTTRTGEKMEMRPRPVDIAVDRRLGEWLTGHDRQLDRAVAELVKQLGAGKR